MSAAWKLILIILFTSLLRSAIFSRALFVPLGANTSTSAHISIDSTSDLNLSAIKPATRQLVEHDAFMRIRYADHERLPNPFQRFVLLAAIVRIASMIELEGDETPIAERFVQIEGNVLLIADHVHHSPTQDLTWGVLGEAISILQDFMRRRPFLLLAEIFEGLDGRGIPIGEISIGPYPVHTTQRDDVQTS